MPEGPSPLQPMNIIESKKRFRVVFEGGSQRFISKVDLPKWAALVDEYWATKKSTQPPAKIRRSPVRTAHPKTKEPPMPAKKGTLTTTRSSSSTQLRLEGKAELDYDPRDLAFVFRGFVEQARGCGPDPHDMFLPPTETRPALSAHHEKLKEMGREIFLLLPAAMSFFNVDNTEWARWYKRAVPPSCGPQHHPAYSDDKLHSPVSTPPLPNRFPLAGISRAAWVAPVVGPISARFGQHRGSEKHEGIDIAVPVGTSVVAPQTLQVSKVGFSSRAGRYIIANVMREDGAFDDGDGYRLTFAHMSSIRVEEDSIVQRGQTLGQSGATGNVTGPHLHFRVQWVEDGIFSDDVVSIDPLAVVPEEVFAGQAMPAVLGARQSVGLKSGQPINIIIAPGSGRVSAGGSGVTQPDVGIQLPSLSSTEDASFRPFDPRGSRNGGGRFGEGDPLQGILTSVVQEAPDFIRNVGNFAQGVGTLASVGGTLASFIPGAAPIAAPIAVAGSAISAGAQPVSQFGAGVVEVGSRILKDAADGDDPLFGII